MHTQVHYCLAFPQVLSKFTCASVHVIHFYVHCFYYYVKLAETAQFPLHQQRYVLHPAIAMANGLLIDHYPSVCPTVLIIGIVRIPSIYLKAKTGHISEKHNTTIWPVHWRNTLDPRHVHAVSVSDFTWQVPTFARPCGHSVGFKCFLSVFFNLNEICAVYI